LLFPKIQLQINLYDILFGGKLIYSSVLKIFASPYQSFHKLTLPACSLHSFALNNLINMAIEQPSLHYAPLKTVNLGALQRGDSEEKNKLFAAAKEDGIFYLSISEDEGEYQLADLVEEIYGLSKSLFKLDLEEKMQYDVDKVGSLKLNG
jgi:hypothetical protein